MGSGRRRASLLFLLAMSVLLPVGSPASAQTSETIYLPWVPNGDTTGGLGPWYGRVELQNPSASTCIVQIRTGKPTGGWTVAATVDLAAYQLADLSPEAIGLASPGGPVTLTASGCQAAASMKQAREGFVDPPWSHGTSGVTGYSGIPLKDTTSEPIWVLPIVQTNNAWNSYIRISNVDTATPARTTIEIFPYQNADGATGSVFSLTVMIASGATRTINVLDSIGLPGFVGFARVSSQGNVVAQVQREKPGAELAMIDIASAYPSALASAPPLDVYQLHAPIVFNAYNGWNTGINLANPNDATANVTISYPGASRSADTVTIAPYSSDYVYTPGNAPDQVGFTGNAVISSDLPVAAAVDEVKYSTNDSISYTATQALSDEVLVPLVFKQSQDGDRNDNSGINVSNAGDSQTTVQITIFNRTGTFLGSFVLDIGPHASDFLYLASASVPSETVGSAMVKSTDGTRIVVVSNDVSYDVDGDGSTAFNAPSPEGIFRIGVPDSP